MHHPQAQGDLPPAAVSTAPQCLGAFGFSRPNCWQLQQEKTISFKPSLSLDWLSPDYTGSSPHFNIHFLYLYLKKKRELYNGIYIFLWGHSSAYCPVCISTTLPVVSFLLPSNVPWCGYGMLSLVLHLPKDICKFSSLEMLWIKIPLIFSSASWCERYGFFLFYLWNKCRVVALLSRFGTGVLNFMRSLWAIAHTGCALSTAPNGVWAIVPLQPLLTELGLVLC